METLHQSARVYQQVVARRVLDRAETGLQEWADLTYMLRLNEWEETAICLYLIREMETPGSPVMPVEPVYQWMVARIRELKLCYPYVLASFSQGVPASLKDL